MIRPRPVLPFDGGWMYGTGYNPPVHIFRPSPSPVGPAPVYGGTGSFPPVSPVGPAPVYGGGTYSPYVRRVGPAPIVGRPSFWHTLFS